MRGTNKSQRKDGTTDPNLKKFNDRLQKNVNLRDVIYGQPYR